MTDRGARWVLALLTLGLAAGVLPVRLPQFWGDAATYHGMAWSLARDGDLRYEARDVLRTRREFASGPQGVFLKRTEGGFRPSASFPFLAREEVASPSRRPVFYAKAFVYPLLAAPFVRLLGTPGMLLANALLLGLALWLGYGELRRTAAPAPALAATLALLLLTVTPIYVLWLAPEVFNLAVIVAGLAAWRRGHPLLSAALLGVAFYSKPYNLFVALPLGLEPLLPGAGRPPIHRRLRETLRRGAVMALVGFGLFGLNALVTGEANYQGGERKTFYGDAFPFELDGTREVTFGSRGIWMTTMQLGPAVEGREAVAAPGAEPPRSAGEIRASFLWNLLYFWVGRFGGALAYFLPAVVALALFLVRGPRDREGWLAASALGVSYLFYILMIPDNWYGGGGTVGNRYFLNLLPLAFYLVPRGGAWPVACGGLVGATVLLGPVLLSPLHHSLRPGDHAMSPAFRTLPAELTMLNDLSVFTEPWRKKRPVGDTEGDAHRHWPADPRSYYLYFTDRGTWGRAEHLGAAGFWLRGGERAEVLLRALEPVSLLTVRVTGGPVGDRVSVATGRATTTLEVAAGETQEAELRPGSPFVYKDSFVHVLRLRSTRGSAGPEFPDRKLGAFVELRLETVPRTRR